MLDELKSDLKRDEGVKYAVYKCTAGKNTIGVGRNLDDNPLKADEVHALGCTTEELIAGKTISSQDADLLLDNDVTRCVHELDIKTPWWIDLPDDVQRGLANMLFNMGWGRLSGFKNMLAALQAGDMAKAADEAAASAWDTQVGARADRIEALFRSAA